MPSLNPTASSGFDLKRLPRHVAAVLWRGSEVAAAAERTVPTGFDVLDAQLPGGGWPTHGLTELLMPLQASCEWRLMGPALTSLLQEGGRIYLIAPPRPPHAPGLAQLGLAPDRLVWVRVATAQEGLWVTEQIVKSRPAGAVLAWLPQARAAQLRRLQIQAQSCPAPVFVLRPDAALHEASPAPLRVTVAPAEGWLLQLRIPKRRGASCEQVLHLPALPANLASVLPPRLSAGPALSRVPSRQEVMHARTLGRAVPTPPVLAP